MVFPSEKTKAWLNHLIGDRDHFSFSHRVYHVTSLLTMVLVLIVIPFNIAMGLTTIALFLTPVLFIQLFLFYLSRFSQKFTLSLIGCILTGYICISLNYYYNSGVDGPTLFLFFFIFQFLTAVTQKKYHILLLVINALIVGALLYADYHGQGWIPFSYPNGLDRFIDIFCTYLFMLVFMYLIIRNLIGSYYTEKKRAEQRSFDLQQQHVELERVTAEKDKLFSMIFHDLKSPLSSIQLYLETLNRISIKKEKEEKIKEDLLKLTKETYGMLENMLLWAKSKIENTKPDLKQVNFVDALASCLLVEQAYAHAKKINIISNTEADIMIYADRTMLQILLRILINNAIKFTPSHAPVEISAHCHNHRCIVRVKDSGMGIPIEKQALIFTLNAHTSNGTADEKGTGLGLVLAKDYADRQGIHIWFESEPNLGASFFLSIPTIS